jgi:hypothetical protein
MRKVTVYQFTNFYIVSRETIRSEEFASRETIASLGGVPIEETAIEVDASSLDNDFFYRVK